MLLCGAGGAQEAAAALPPDPSHQYPPQVLHVLGGTWVIGLDGERTFPYGFLPFNQPVSSLFNRDELLNPSRIYSHGNAVGLLGWW